MGCYHDSEPSIDEQSGLDAVPGRRLIPEDDIDRALHLLREEEIAENGKPDVDHGLVVTDPEQQIFKLYVEYRPRLHRYIHSMHLKRDVAEEVIQETFLRLTTELLQGRDIDNVQGWITRVAHNLAVDVIKRNEKDGARLTDLTSVEHEASVDPESAPDESYRRKEQLRRLEIALLTLNSQQRQCFNLRVQGFRYKDIAKALHISEQRAAIVVKQVTVRLAALCA